MRVVKVGSLSQQVLLAGGVGGPSSAICLMGNCWLKQWVGRMVQQPHLEAVLWWGGHLREQGLQLLHNLLVVGACQVAAHLPAVVQELHVSGPATAQAGSIEHALKVRESQVACVVDELLNIAEQHVAVLILDKGQGCGEAGTPSATRYSRMESSQALRGMGRLNVSIAGGLARALPIGRSSSLMPATSSAMVAGLDMMTSLPKCSEARSGKRGIVTIDGPVGILRIPFLLAFSPPTFQGICSSLNSHLPFCNTAGST